MGKVGNIRKVNLHLFKKKLYLKIIFYSNSDLW